MKAFTIPFMKSDWDRFDALTDDEIDASDIPPLDDSFFANAELRLPEAAIPVTIRLDPDVIDWFKSFGRDYQARINAVLRTYMEAHRE